jgi:phage terminase large subunit-like protein
VDPTNTSGGDAAGIITAGATRTDFYPLEDNSLQGSPQEWASAAVAAYFRHNADCIVAEDNNGGEMVEFVIRQIVKDMKAKDSRTPDVRIKRVHASRGKATRAEPIAAIYEQGHGHHVGNFAQLEDEMCLWIPGDPSPNRMDALVWAGTELMLKSGVSINTKATVGNYIGGVQQQTSRPFGGEHGRE